MQGSLPFSINKIQKKIIIFVDLENYSTTCMKQGNNQDENSTEIQRPPIEEKSKKKNFWWCLNFFFLNFIAFRITQERLPVPVDKKLDIKNSTSTIQFLTESQAEDHENSNNIIGSAMRGTCGNNSLHLYFKNNIIFL